MDTASLARQFVVLSEREAPPDASMAPIASRAELLDMLKDQNTGPEREGDDVLYGPGIRLEMTPGQDPIVQMLATITEEEIGERVLFRLVKDLHWKLVDPNTGREFTSSGV